MLNIFPDLLVYSLWAPTILRLVAGLVFVDLGLVQFKGEHKRVLGIIKFAGGAMLILGAYTQVAALVLALITLYEAYVEYKDPALLKRTLVFYIMLFAITLSLLFTGAGAFSLDLPL